MTRFCSRIPLRRRQPAQRFVERLDFHQSIVDNAPAAITSPTPPSSKG